MKHRLQHFLEWFALNEHSIAQLPNLRPDKKLFWLHWIQWHLDYYVPGTDFCILFAKEGHTFHVLRQNPFPPKTIPAHFTLKHFHLSYHTNLSSAGTLDNFEQHLIHDIEPGPTHSLENSPTGDQFLQTTFKQLTSFSKYEQAPVVVEIISQGQPGSVHPVLVKLSGMVILNDRVLIKMVEFDLYMDLINRQDSET